MSLDGTINEPFAPPDDAGAQSAQDDTKKHWGLRDAREVIATLRDKQSEYYQAVQRSGLAGMWRTAYAQYYGTDPSNPGEMATQRLKRVGPEKEFTRFRVNEWRSFVMQATQTALGTRPAFKATADNSNFDALASIAGADRAINHVMKTSLPEPSRRQWLELALVVGAGYAHLRWDADGGDDTTEEVQAIGPDGEKQFDFKPLMDPQTGQPVPDPENGGAPKIVQGDPIMTEVPARSGEPVVDILGPWETYFEARAKKITWQVVREEVSKWELAALFPDLADELIAMGGLDEYVAERIFGYDSFNVDSEDMVVLQHFYLPRSAGAPDGRYLGFVDDLPLFDGPLPLTKSKNRVPVYALCPSPYIGRSFGYSKYWDLIAPNELIDNVQSDWASNVRAFGRLMALVPKGAGIDKEAWAMGVRALGYTPGVDSKPSYMDPPKIPDVTPLLQWSLDRMESMSAQNSVSRGKPAANIESGSYAALLDAKAIEYMSDVQESFDGAVTDLANGALEMVAERSKGEFMAEIAGESERPYYEAFKRTQLKGVRSVRIETIDPFMRTVAGNLEIWNAIAKAPPQDRGAIIRGISQGDWSGITDVDKSCDLRIVWENEQLMKGHVPNAWPSDKHDIHVREHLALAERLITSLSPEELNDPTSPGGAALGAIFAHVSGDMKQGVEGHVQVWQAIDPRLAMILGMPLPPPMPMSPTGDMTAMGMIPGGAGAPAPAAAGGDPNAPPPSGGDPNGAPAAGTMPKMPKPAEPAQPPEVENTAA